MKVTGVSFKNVLVLLSCRCFFTIAPTGRVSRIYYEEQDVEALKLTRRNLVSALSGHFQVHALEMSLEYT